MIIGWFGNQWFDLGSRKVIQFWFHWQIHMCCCMQFALSNSARSKSSWTDLELGRCWTYLEVNNMIWCRIRRSISCNFWIFRIHAIAEVFGLWKNPKPASRFRIFMEKLAVIRFFTLRSLTPAAIHAELMLVYGEDALVLYTIRCKNVPGPLSRRINKFSWYNYYYLEAYQCLIISYLGDFL
jgi:hypothetical protein